MASTPEKSMQSVLQYLLQWVKVLLNHTFFQWQCWKNAQNANSHTTFAPYPELSPPFLPDTPCLHLICSNMQTCSFSANNQWIETKHTVTKYWRSWNDLKWGYTNNSAERQLIRKRSGVLYNSSWNIGKQTIWQKKWFNILIYLHFWFRYDLGQKYYAPQVRPDQGSNSWTPDQAVQFMSLRRLL